MLFRLCKEQNGKKRMTGPCGPIMGRARKGVFEQTGANRKPD